MDRVSLARRGCTDSTLSEQGVCIPLSTEGILIFLKMNMIMGKGRF